MNITMTITAENPEDLFSTLKGCSQLIREDCPTAVPEANSQALGNLPANPTPAAAPCATTIAPDVPVAETVPLAPITAAPSAVPTTPAPAYTLDQLNRAGADLVTKKPDLMPQLNALMAEMGVQTLAQLKPDMYGTVAQRLRTLGAAI